MRPGYARLHPRKSSIATYLTLCFIVCSLLFTACGSTATTFLHKHTPKPAASTLDELVAPDYLTIGTSPDEPPMTFMDSNTRQVNGFDIDLIKAIASAMGLQARIVPTSSSELLSRLRAGHLDVVISGVVINDEHKQEANFIPYLSLGESLLVQKGNPHAIESLADLCDQSVGVLSNTIEQTDLQTASELCNKAGQGAITSVALQDQSAVIQLLATKRVVAIYQDSPVTHYYLAQDSSRFELAGSVINTAIAGIAVSKTDTSIQEAIQAAFDQVTREGTYQILLEKWGLTSGAIP